MASATIRWEGPAALQEARRGLAQGLNQAAEHLAALSTPLVPYLDGDLTDSQDVHQVDEATVEQGAQVQYGTPYAVYQHEGGDATRTVTRYTQNPHPEAGSHFLSRPLEANRATLQAIIAQSVKGALG